MFQCRFSPENLESIGDGYVDRQTVCRINNRQVR